MLGLKYLRKSLGLTGDDLANELGVSKSLISKWESGKQKISEKHKETIVLKYGGYAEFLDKELDKNDEFLIDTSLSLSKKKRYSNINTVDEYNQRVLRLLSHDKGSEVLGILLMAAEGYILHNIKSLEDDKSNNARNCIMNILQLTFGNAL